MNRCATASSSGFGWRQSGCGNRPGRSGTTGRRPADNRSSRARYARDRVLRAWAVADLGDSTAVRVSTPTGFPSSVTSKSSRARPVIGLPAPVADHDIDFDQVDAGPKRLGGRGGLCKQANDQERRRDQSFISSSASSTQPTRGRGDAPLRVLRCRPADSQARYRDTARFPEVWPGPDERCADPCEGGASARRTTPRVSGPRMCRKPK